jgi:hypothetical protein
MDESKKQRSWHLWTLAVVLTLASAVYQRMTGPTYPVRDEISIAGEIGKFRLPRSHPGEGDAEVRVHVSNTAVTGYMDYRRYRSLDQWSRLPLERDGDRLLGYVPHQPPAGKVMYRVCLQDGAIEPVALTEEPVIIRFRGDVPAFVLIPHIILIFGAMLLSTRTGLEALLRRPGIRRLTVHTAIWLFLGGLVGGPVVQKFAFEAFWTGWPFGHDLTDNKTAVAMIFWIIALWVARKKPDARAWPIAAAVVTFVIFVIPHSVLGSELDYTKSPSQPAATQPATTQA